MSRDGPRVDTNSDCERLRHSLGIEHHHSLPLEYGLVTYKIPLVSDRDQQLAIAIVPAFQTNL